MFVCLVLCITLSIVSVLSAMVYGSYKKSYGNMPSFKDYRVDNFVESTDCPDFVEVEE